MYGSQRLPPSMLFFVDFLIPFPKAVKLFLSVRQENLGFSLSELCQLSDIQMLSKPNSLEPLHPSRTVTRLLSPVWERICIFSLRPTLCPGCAPSLNNSCKHVFSYLPFQSWHITRLNNSHCIVHFLTKGRQWESI